MNNDPYSFLALGDSYTHGENVLEEERWSVQVITLLKNRGIDIVHHDIIARTGWTTTELVNGIKCSENKKKYSMVSLLIGVNDQYRGESMTQFKTAFHTLLRIAIAFVKGNKDSVFVLSIPDWSVTPYAVNLNRKKIADEIDAFNSAAAQVCAESKIMFIDITGLSRLAWNDSAMIASDGLHLSGKMYALWAEKVLPIASSILNKNQ